MINKQKLILILTLTLQCYLTCNTFALEEDNFRAFPPDKIMMLQFKSKIDATSQPLLIKTPKNYTPEKQWPLLVVLHGLGDGPIWAPDIDSMLQIGPYGRGDKWYTGIGEEDVLESIEFAKKLFPIDENRIYLAGFSMGGYGTFRLASRFPDIWAACVPVCPRVPQDFRLENCSSVPFWIHTGEKDYRLPSEPCAELYAKSQHVGIKNWQYTEHASMGHSFNINWTEVEAWLSKQVRLDTPLAVNFSTHSSSSTKAYWLEVLKTKDANKEATIKGERTGSTINIESDNVAAFRLDLSSFNNVLNEEVVIYNNSKEVFKATLPDNRTFEWEEK